MGKKKKKEKIEFRKGAARRREKIGRASGCGDRDGEREGWRAGLNPTPEQRERDMDYILYIIVCSLSEKKKLGGERKK